MDCFVPNGTSRNLGLGLKALGRYTPCTTGSGHSMCCSQTGGGADVCISNNSFCRDLSGNQWRESCTDPSWQDPACKKLFVNGTGYPGTAQTYVQNGDPLNDVEITICDDTETYCFGANNRLCCQQKQGVYLDASGSQRATDPSSSVSSSSSILSSTSSARSSSTASTSISSAASGLSTGAKAGIGAGVGGAVLLALVVGVCIFIAKKRNPRKAQAPLQHEMSQPDTVYGQSSYEVPGRLTQEVGQGKRVYGSPQIRAELDGAPLR